MVDTDKRDAINRWFATQSTNTSVLVHKAIELLKREKKLNGMKVNPDPDDETESFELTIPCYFRGHIVRLSARDVRRMVMEAA